MFDTGQPHSKTPADWDRRTFLKASGLTIGGLSLASLIAACSGAGGGGSSSGTLTLRLPFLADMQVPDPDIMYEGEGVQVMECAYEGLVRYKPGTPEFIPGLAKSWTHLRRPTDVYLLAAARREVPRRYRRRRRRMVQELQAPRRHQPGAGLHGYGRGQDGGAEPDDVRRHAQLLPTTRSCTTWRVRGSRSR